MKRQLEPPLEIVYPAGENLVGEIRVGDLVETLDNKRAIIGPVKHINKKKRATVKGVEYEGGPEVTWTTHVENLRLIKRGGSDV